MKSVLMILLFFSSFIGMSLEKSDVFEHKSTIELLKIGDSFSYSTFINAGCMSSMARTQDSITIRRDSLFYEFRYYKNVFSIPSNEIQGIIDKEKLLVFHKVEKEILYFTRVYTVKTGTTMFSFSSGYSEGWFMFLEYIFEYQEK